MSWLLSGRVSAADARVDAKLQDAIVIESATSICRAASRPEAQLLA
jgi:hypothetical protein